MKKVLVLILMTALSASVIAQKGSFYAGGVVGYGSTTNKDVDGKKDVTSNWAFGPEVGTFLSDKIQLGIALGLDGSTSKLEGSEYHSSSGFNPTIYCRDFHKITDNFSYFLGLYLNYLSGTETATDISSGTSVESKHSGFGASIGFGVAYALSPRWTAVGQYGVLGYSSVSNKKGGSDDGSDSGFELGVNTVGGSSFTQGNGSGAVFNIGIYYTISPGGSATK